MKQKAKEASETHDHSASPAPAVPVDQAVEVEPGAGPSKPRKSKAARRKATNQEDAPQKSSQLVEDEVQIPAKQPKPRPRPRGKRKAQEAEKIPLDGELVDALRIATPTIAATDAETPVEEPALYDPPVADVALDNTAREVGLPDEVSSPPKRGRGRPRKHPTGEETESAPAAKRRRVGKSNDDIVEVSLLPISAGCCL